MKSVSTITLALALALGGGAVAFAPAVAKEKPAAAKYTPAVQNAAAAAQEALKKNDTATAAAKLAEAKPLVATDDDRFVVGSLLVQLGQATNDRPMTSSGVDLMAASNKGDAALKPKLYLMQGQFAYDAKNYPAAEAAFRQALAAGSDEPNLVPMIVQVQGAQGRTVEGLQTLNAEIDKKVAAGQPVPSDWYARGINDGYAAKSGSPTYAQSAAATTELTKKWVASYPTKSNWRDTLVIYRDMNRIPADVELDMYRLLRTIGGLKGERDYMDYVQASYLRFPAEANAVLDEAAAANQLNLATNKGAAEIKGLVKGKVAADKASLPASAKSSATAANGRAAFNTGDAYYGYGEWQQAIDMYKLALSKGGVDVDVVNLHMGMAQARLGQKDAAKATFAQVKGSRQQLAAYWTIYLDHPVTA